MYCDRATLFTLSRFTDFAHEKALFVAEKKLRRKVDVEAISQMGQYNSAEVQEC